MWNKKGLIKWFRTWKATTLGRCQHITLEAQAVIMQEYIFLFYLRNEKKMNNDRLLRIKNCLS